MRLLLTTLLGALLLVAACNQGATVETTPLPSANTPSQGTGPVDGEVLATGTLTTTLPLTAPETVTAGGAITATGGITAQEQLTATGEAGLLGVASLQNIDGELIGNAIFTQNGGEVTIQITVEGFTGAAAGPHGVHLHTLGACTPDFAAAGSHFNPASTQHGLDNPAGPHAGDLPNLELDADGNASYEATTQLVTLGAGGNSLFDSDGSAIVIHAAVDDQVTDPAGNSGDRIACGVIEAQ